MKKKNPATKPRTPPPLPVDLALLVAECVQRGYPEPEREYHFLDGRKFRFDLAWPTLLVAFEREGSTWGKSRHTSGAGYRNDCTKYNYAVLEGWRVLRATVDMLRDGTAATMLLILLAQATCEGARS